MKSSRTAIRVMLTAGFLYVGSYGQDSLGVSMPVDASQKNAEKSAITDQSTVQTNSVVVEKAVQPTPATATTAANQNTISSPRGNGEPKLDITISYVTEKETAGSVASIKSDQLEKDPASNVLKSLQGRAAGVNIMRTNKGGTPGTPMAVRIRGINSINSNNPLYVVDGVPVRSIDYLNPNDVESVSILKNPSETAIYGSQGSNGVVLVTTKTAK